MRFFARKPRRDWEQEWRDMRFQKRMLEVEAGRLRAEVWRLKTEACGDDDFERAKIWAEMHAELMRQVAP